MLSVAHRLKQLESLVLLQHQGPLAGPLLQLGTQPGRGAVEELRGTGHAVGVRPGVVVKGLGDEGPRSWTAHVYGSQNCEQPEDRPQPQACVHAESILIVVMVMINAFRA